MSTTDSVSPLGLSLPQPALARDRRAPRRRLQFAPAALALVTVLATHLFNFGSGSRIGLLDASSSASWSHVLIAAILVLATLTAATGLRLARTQRAPWVAAAGILAFLAVAEISPLHASIDRMAWGKLLYVPLLFVLGVCLWRLWAGAGARSLVRTGLGTLILSYAIHVLGPHVVQALGWGTGSWAYQVKVGLKQGTELAGWLLILLGLGSQLAARRTRH
ncbi:MAG: hypothetical protein QOF83_2347 [Solirubrobacteraceae bacterium]|jgi:hypothetical protein|nr:hypothetical protein [Solirubrobacteraceae bacterium]